MDNLIEIIITFFVIYSIINMIAGGKKQKDKSKLPEADNYDLSSSRENYRQQKNERTITLEDIFGLKIPETEYEKTESKRSENISLENLSWDPEKEFEEKIKQKESLEYRNIEKNLPDIDYDKTPSYEIAAVRRVVSQDVKVYEEKKVFDNRLLNIKSKLNNPDTLRELFIISEILSKPKSLRR